MKSLWILFAALLWMPGLAAADPCDFDRTSTCGDVRPGDGHVYDCLIGRSDRVKPECASAANRAGELADAVVGACRNDAEQWCAQHKNAGRPAIIECLKAHRDKVTDACKSRYRQFKAFGFDVRS